MLNIIDNYCTYFMLLRMFYLHQMISNNISWGIWSLMFNETCPFFQGISKSKPRNTKIYKTEGWLN